MAASGPGPPGDGVVQNSALSFVAQAQVLGTGESSNSQDAEAAAQADRLVPAGLKALYDACSEVYPDQPNPLQVTTRLKYWLGGDDPLDYISMYWHPGLPEERVPPHWHYVSFGLSDLHGDGRVHPLPSAPEPAPAQPSGLGLELTLRLAAAPGPPPLWPAALLQALARYMFATGNKFVAGDHVSWHAALDASESRVRHLLVGEDAQLRPVSTPHGRVAFLQLVGCTGRELRAAQRSSGFEVLRLLQEDPSCGGSWLVTCVSRSSARAARALPRARAPAHLAGVSARLAALPWSPNKEDGSGALTPRAERQIKDTLQRGLCTMAERPAEVSGHMSTDSFEMSSIEKALPEIPELMQGSCDAGAAAVEWLPGVHLLMNPEAASLLPLAIDGRVLHGRHFTWRWGPRAVTVLSPRVAGAFVTAARPIGRRGDWVQILLSPELARQVSQAAAPLARLAADSDSEPDDPAPAPATASATAPAPPALPLTLAWPEHGLKVSVLYDQLL